MLMELRLDPTFTTRLISSQGTAVTTWGRLATGKRQRPKKNARCFIRLVSTFKIGNCDNWLFFRLDDHAHLQLMHFVKPIHRNHFELLPRLGARFTSRCCP